MYLLVFFFFHLSGKRDKKGERSASGWPTVDTLEPKCLGTVDPMKPKQQNCHLIWFGFLKAPAQLPLLAFHCLLPRVQNYSHQEPHSLRCPVQLRSFPAGIGSWTCLGLQKGQTNSLAFSFQHPSHNFPLYLSLLWLLLFTCQHSQHQQQPTLQMPGQGPGGPPWFPHLTRGAWEQPG